MTYGLKYHHTRNPEHKRNMKHRLPVKSYTFFRSTNLILPCAEWEYACRAGTTTRYSFGDDESKLGDYGWYAENSGSRSPQKGDYFGYDKDDWFENIWKGKTHSVGQKKPNPWGLYDMHGNVLEWVQDKWHDSYDGAPTDGSAWKGYGANRVIRGGSWNDAVWYCRSAYRTCYDPRYRNIILGFRLLQEL